MLSLLVLLLALPLTAFAEETVPNVTGEFNLFETNQGIEKGQVYREEQPVYSEQFLLVEEDKDGNISPSPKATIGGISEKEGEKTYIIVPLKSAEFTIK
jgi:hypothetical protein